MRGLYSASFEEFSSSEPLLPSSAPPSTLPGISSTGLPSSTTSSVSLGSMDIGTSTSTNPALKYKNEVIIGRVGRGQTKSRQKNNETHLE
ncbi:Protein of unknown function [Cotesia congregata]|uniref:Uncharacterized protein n=1 Tax=Cotesia congregata TaxID=51543 RepID=A0A8J2H829_COTCN|nr:Protein of unknown function [Cotesia congregata]